MNALFILIDQIISIYLYTLIAYVIITLLVQFEIVNRYNRIIDLILRGLIALHEPLLIKIRKYIPFIGGMDFSPVIVILLLSFILTPKVYNNKIDPLSSNLEILPNFFKKNLLGKFQEFSYVYLSGLHVLFKLMISFIRQK